jgi:hypothetical protein
MIKKTVVLLIILVSFFHKTDAQIIVNGLKLKYVLIHSAWDMYFYNTHMPFIWKLAQNKERKNHNRFLTDTYHKLPKEKKQQLSSIFLKSHAWQYINKITGLSDSANIEMIVECLTKSPEKDTSINEAIKSFFPYFYENCLKSYMLECEPQIDSLADRVQIELNEKKIDVLDFMENESGVKFGKRYNVEFYYTLGFMWNMGFISNNIKISTISQSSRSVDKILGTVFHEFSHELFQTFTKSENFKNLSDSLKKDKKFMKSYNKAISKNYSWTAWCEENMVNGFSQYLVFKYNGAFRKGYTAYDDEFFKYLKELPFDPAKESLSDVSYGFLRGIIINAN